MKPWGGALPIGANMLRDARMPYELIQDGKLLALGDRQYLLSPQDLAGLEVLDQLMEISLS